MQQLDQVVEAETGEPRCWLFGGNLPDLVELAARGSMFPRPSARERHAGGRQLWGRAIVNGQLVMAEGKAVATLPPGARFLPTIRWPPDSARPGRAAAKRRSWCSGTSCWARQSTRSTSARAAGLPAGVGPAVIAAPWPSAGFNSGNGVDQAGLTFVKDTVLLPQGNRLLFCPIPAAVRKDLPVPLVLKYPRIGIGSVQKPLEVQFAAVGGEGRRTFTAARKYEGLVLDAAGGKATLDLPAIWKKCLSALKQPAGRLSLERQADTVRSEFRRLTGRPLAADQFAFAVPLEVMVSDEQGQQDRLNLSVIVLAPAEELVPRTLGWDRGTPTLPAFREARLQPPKSTCSDEAATDRAAADLRRRCCKRRWPDSPTTPFGRSSANWAASACRPPKWSAPGAFWAHRAGRPLFPDRLWGVKDEPRPLAVQIWDNDPESAGGRGRTAGRTNFASAWSTSTSAARSSNVTERAHSGSYLLRYPERMRPHHRRVVAACLRPTPVTAKIRLGCTRDTINAIDVAQAVEAPAARP